MKSFRYDFTTKELMYFVFGRKNCPNCGNKMKKIKKCEIVDGSKFNTNNVPLYIQGSKEVKHYYYVFSCPQCGAEYKLEELAKK